MTTTTNPTSAPVTITQPVSIEPLDLYFELSAKVHQYMTGQITLAEFEEARSRLAGWAARIEAVQS